MLSSDGRIGRARAALEQRGQVAGEFLQPDIAESWSRCLLAGLDPGRPSPMRVAGAAAVREARERHAPALRLAQAEMQSLHQQIAGTNFLIAFAAPDGMLLDAVTDASFAPLAREAGIRPGASWTEGARGTNGLGLAAASGRPATVHGGEHFFNCFGGLTCSAVPVFAPDGSLAGVLDASSDCRSRQQHTSALVAMAARQVENGLFRAHHRADIIIVFHSRAEYLNTLSAGLLAVAPDGTLLGANERAHLLLHGLPVRPGRRFAELFRTGLAVLLDPSRREERQLLQDRLGSSFVARAETMPRAPVAAAAPRTGCAPGFVADDPAIQLALRQAEAAAVRKLPILLRGETGTGKEHLARHAHAASGRRGAFVPVNCAALPAGLIEAELFGHVEGAFSGARRGGAPGLVLHADGGTLFLDEIGDMPPGLQAVLLRLLDGWQLRPVGGTRAREVDVLLIAATNADLEAKAASGGFRADLLHRVATVEIRLPPLRGRRDFAALVRQVLHEVAPRSRITDAALRRLAARDWNGNIRELRAVLTRLTLLDPDRLIDEGATGLPQAANAAPGPLRTAMRGLVIETLRDTDGNVSEAARRLGVSRNAVYRVLRGAAGVPP